ncbi:MAG: hypothetical protein ACI4P4_08210 [Faecousia sp.]
MSIAISPLLFFEFKIIISQEKQKGNRYSGPGSGEKGARRTSRAPNLCNRFFPGPLGIVPLTVRQAERTTGCILK